QLPHDAKTDPCAARAGGGTEAIGRADLQGRTAPGATANHAQLAAGVDPGRAAARSAHIVVVPAIIHPFGKIAVNVEKAKRVDRKSPDRCRPLVATVVAREGVAPAALAR